MSKLLQILTADKDDVQRQNAEIEVAQQNVNLQAFRIATQRNLQQLERKANEVLRSGGPSMWATYDTLSGQIADTKAALDRIDQYAAEYFA